MCVITPEFRIKSEKEKRNLLKASNVSIIAAPEKERKKYRGRN